MRRARYLPLLLSALIVVDPAPAASESPRDAHANALHAGSNGRFPSGVPAVRDSGAADSGSVGARFAGLIRFLGKLSGPGPFIGGGVALEYGVSGERGKIFVPSLAMILSTSLENKLTYSSVDSTDSTGGSVHMVTVQPAVEIDLSRVLFKGDGTVAIGIGAAVGMHVFIGENFSPFARFSIGPRMALTFSRRVKLGVSIDMFGGFSACDFGALYGLVDEGVESVPGAFFQLYFDSP